MKYEIKRDYFCDQIFDESNCVYILCMWNVVSVKFPQGFGN